MTPLVKLDRHCPACLEYRWIQALLHPELTREGDEVRLATYYACQDCGIAMKWPQPSEEALRRYYGTAWQYSSERPGYERAAEFIARGIRAPGGVGAFPLQAGLDLPIGDGTLLDVGSKGDALALALGDCGTKLTPASLDAQPQRAGIEKGWLGDGKEFPANHSLVAATHVLEHVLRPDLFLHDLASLTAPQGYLYIEVPSQWGARFDVGLCDDLNRNHLWHFGITGLVTLAKRAGLQVVLAESDLSFPGWPVDRLLLRNQAPGEHAAASLGYLSQEIRSEYLKAATALYGEDPKKTALYGASHSYALLRHYGHARVMEFPLYDRFKAGEVYKKTRILHPDNLHENGIERVYVTTRSWNSLRDIAGYLAGRHPWLEVRTLYPSLEPLCASFTSVSS